MELTSMQVLGLLGAAFVIGVVTGFMIGRSMGRQEGEEDTLNRIEAYDAYEAEGDTENCKRMALGQRPVRRNPPRPPTPYESVGRMPASPEPETLRRAPPPKDP